MAPSVPTPPKVSFIPKTSLVRDDSFLERRRPRSFLVFVAIFAIVASLGSYIGLTYYEKTLATKVSEKVKEVTTARDILVESKVIDDARVFQAQAGLVQQILDAHIVLSPIFDFLSKATIASVMYDSFVFKQDSGTQIIELKGEAPSYASLAYQSDILKKRKEETKEISDYSFSGVSLSRFGTVDFSLKITFAPGYLSYTNTSRRLAKGEESNIQPISMQDNGASTSASPALATSPIAGMNQGSVSPSSSNIGGQAVASVVVDTGISSPAPMLNQTSSAPEQTPEVIPEPVVTQVESAQGEAKTSFWSWFKFW